MALRSGIGIAGIDLWLFGGVAKMERDTRTAGEEFRVAVAGPLVTLLIALVCLGAGALLSGADRALDSARLDAVSGDEALSVLGWLAFVNLALLVFNLIPGFPLDGGRIARAIAWWRTGDRARATRFAARLGRGVLGADDRLRRVPAAHGGDREWHLAGLHRLLPRAGRAVGRGADRPDRAGSRGCWWRT